MTQGARGSVLLSIQIVDRGREELRWDWLDFGSGRMKLVGLALKTKGVAVAWGLDGWDKVPNF